MTCYMGLLGSKLHLFRASSVNCSAISPALLHPLLMEEKEKRRKKGRAKGKVEGERRREERSVCIGVALYTNTHSQSHAYTCMNMHAHRRTLS